MLLLGDGRMAAVVVMVVVVAVVVIVAVLVLAEPLAAGGVERWLGRPLSIEAVLGRPGGAHAEEAAEPEPPPGDGAALGARDGVGDGGRREHLVDGVAAVAPVVDERGHG